MTLRGATAAIDERFVFLPDDWDFLLVPVSEGMCKYESLVDGTLFLKDVLIMHAFLSNKYHNREVAYESRNRGRMARQTGL